MITVSGRNRYIMPLSGAVAVMSNPKVKAKVTKMLATPRKKMKKLLANRRPRKGYAKIAIQHDQIYEDEDLEMDVDLGYGLNEQYEYTESDEPEHNLFGSTTGGTGGGSEYPTSIKIKSPRSSSTSVTQTFLDDVMAKGIYRKTEFCLVPFYLLVLMLSILTTSLLAADQVSSTEGMSILCTFTVMGSVLGMYFVYQWGIFDDVLVFLNTENGKYQDNTDRLTAMGEVLQNDVQDIHKKIEALNRDGMALEECVRAYDLFDLELQQFIDGLNENGAATESGNRSNDDVQETLKEVLKEVERLQNEVETVMEDNEKGTLLSIFYSVKLYDYGRGNCLDRKQYDVFLQHCNTETRAKFEKYGGFEAMDPNQSGLILQHYFEQMVHKVLADTIEDSQHLLDSAIKIRGNL